MHVGFPDKINVQLVFLFVVVVVCENHYVFYNHQWRAFSLPTLEGVASLNFMTRAYQHQYQNSLKARQNQQRPDPTQESRILLHIPVHRTTFDRAHFDPRVLLISSFPQ